MRRGQFQVHMFRALITVSVSLSIFAAFGTAPQTNSGQPSEDVWKALTSGKVTFNNRLRGEFVEQDGLRPAQALTNRILLSYTTGNWRGASAHVGMTHIKSLTYDRYNAAGLNHPDVPNRAVVADPEMTELNQLYIQYVQPRQALLRFGRQRILHEDQRFIGNVGWRQNEQTFDAMTLESSFGIDKLAVKYHYLWQVHRIFGPDHPDGKWDSDSHLFLASYQLPCLKSLASVFLYQLQFDQAAANSTNTFGLHFTGETVIADKRTFHWDMAWAHQTDARNNPQSFHVNYYRFHSHILDKRWGRLGASWELLGSSGGRNAFQTPLATLHAWQGWADVFLRTPANGLEDFHLEAGLPMTRNFAFLTRYHWFRANHGHAPYGEEWDVQMTQRLNDNAHLLLKYANFNGKSGFSDRQILWIQTEVSF